MNDNYNIPVIAEFQKVSKKQFLQDYVKTTHLTGEEAYEKAVLPVRSSKDSAGHDFVLTKDITLNPGEQIAIQTGIKAKIAPGWVLMIMPRSGLGVKYRVQLNNTVGVIDGDYFDNEGNEGHILITITNDSKKDKVLALNAGDRFVQGIFIPYGITNHDEPLGLRTGGHGSSGL